MSIPGVEHLRRLSPRATHGDVQRHVSAFLEAVLDWKLVTERRTESGIIDSLPIGPAARPIPVFVIEYKSHASATLQELENKSGSRPGDTALQQLVGYMTTERMTLFGILADASRLAVYTNAAGRVPRAPILHIEFENISEADVIKLRSRLPLSTDETTQLEITNQEEFIDFLSSMIDVLRDPLVAMLRRYQPKEQALLSQLFPVAISPAEFADKTAASLVSKLLLIRAMEDQNDRFGAIINPVVAKSFGKSQYGFIVLAHSAYELASTKFPHVFKADIDVFDWWFPSNLTSQRRAELRDLFDEMNTRLFGVLQRLWAYHIAIKSDLMGIAYQKLRATSEAAILGAYFTPPPLTEFTLNALLAYLEKPFITLNRTDLLDARGGEHRIIDITCGSGTFLVSLAAQSIADTRRAPQDCARDLISRLHGIDIDPLAVLMARSQTFAALAKHLQDAPPPHVYWQNALTLLDPPATQLGLFDDFTSIGTAIEEAKHDTEECHRLVTENSFSFVIGNPPWGRRSQIGLRMRKTGVPTGEIDQRLNEMVSGSWADWFRQRDDNLLSPFVSIAAKLLRDRGVLAIILDARFIAAEWGERCIEILERDFEHVWILDISSEQGFPYSTSYPVIVLAQRKER